MHRVLSQLRCFGTIITPSDPLRVPETAGVLPAADADGHSRLPRQPQVPGPLLRGRLHQARQRRAAGDDGRQGDVREHHPGRAEARRRGAVAAAGGWGGA